MSYPSTENDHPYMNLTVQFYYLQNVFRHKVDVCGRGREGVMVRDRVGRGLFVNLRQKIHKSLPA